MQDLRMIIGVGVAGAAAVVSIVALRRDDPVVPAERAEAHVVGLSAAAAPARRVAVQRAAAARCVRGQAQAQQRARGRRAAQPQAHAARTSAAVQQQAQRGARSRRRPGARGARHVHALPAAAAARARAARQCAHGRVAVHGEGPQRVAEAARARGSLGTHQQLGRRHRQALLGLRLLSEPELDQTLSVERLT